MMTLPGKKIILLITSLAFGGAETQLCRLAAALKQREWDVKVVSMIAPQAYEAELNQQGIPVLTLHMSRGKLSPGALFSLAEIIKKERPDILHSHMVHANLLARIVRLLVRIPVVVCTAHNICEGGGHRDWWYRLTDFLCDVTTQVSKAGVQRYVQRKMVDPKKILFFPNGVDTRDFKKDESIRQKVRALLAADNDLVWLAAGRFEEAKDYPNMIHAFSGLLKKDARNVLWIAGEGSLRPQIEALIKTEGMGGRVKLLGIRKDMPELMNGADAYVMSSAWEGMPMVLLEAAACELPIVATDVGGNRETMKVRETGFLVPPKNPAMLAEALQELMSLPEEKRLMMGREGRKYIEATFNLKNIVGKWESLYQGLLDKK